MINEFNGLYKVKKKDIVECGRILTDAFRNDPKWGRLFDGVGDRQRNAFFQEPASYCLKYGKVFAPSENMEGIIAVVPGKYSEMTIMRVLKTCLISTYILGGIELLKFLGKLDTTFEPLEKTREKIMKDREYLYIFIIGVKSKLHGKGFGWKMLNALCEYADRAGLPVYLETTTQKNVEMYKRYGFIVVDKIVHPEFDLPQWAMIREAKELENNKHHN